MLIGDNETTARAIGSGDNVLMRDDLREIVNAIHLNFVWAYGYNVLLIPVAAGHVSSAWRSR